MKYKVYCFSVFETLITSNLEDDKSRFLFLQYQIFQDYKIFFEDNFRNNFFDIRKNAEKIIKEDNDRKDINLESIYKKIAITYGLKNLQKDILVSLEENIIIKYSNIIEENIVKIKRLLNQGNRVVLINNSYLSKGALQTLLKKYDSQLSNLDIYFYRDIKDKKRIFDYILEQEDISAKDLYYMGNKEVSNNKAIKVQDYSFEYKNEFIKYYLKDKDLLSHIIASSIKEYSLNYLKDNKLSLDEVIAKDFYIPYFYGFVEKCLFRAKKEGIKKLYFLARDCHILYKMAEIISKERELEIEIKYLYSSRNTIKKANLSDFIINRDLIDIFNLPDMLNIELIATRLNLTAKDIFNKIPREYKKRIKDSTSFIPRRYYNVVEKVIYDNFLQEIKIKGRGIKERVLGYLKQELLFNQENKIAIVDTGYSQNYQNNLYNLLSKENPDIRLQFYYFLIPYRSSFISTKNDLWKWDKEDISKKKQVDINEILNISDKGVIIDYRYQDDKWYPIFGKDNLVDINNFNLKEYERIILDITLILTKKLRQDFKCFNYCFFDIYKNLCESFEDSNILIKKISTTKFTSDEQDFNIKEYAPKFSLVELVKYIFIQTSFKRRMTRSLSYSIKRSSFITRALFMVLKNIIRKKHIY